VMFITVAIDLLVQPKGQSRSPKESRTKEPKIILKVPSNITLMPLPPRAPELNGQENIWQELALKSASRAQSFYAPGSTHLGSLSLRHLNRLQVNQWAELGPLLLDRDQ
jgi:hypothetical protein